LERSDEARRGHPFSKALYCCLILLAANACASFAQATDNEDLEQWASEFSLLALDPERGPANGYVNKWVGEIRFSIEGRQLNPLIDEMITTHLDRLRDVTRLNYVRTKGQDARLRILYLSSSERLNPDQWTGSPEFQKHVIKWHSAPDAPCTFTFKRKRGVLVSADVYIKSEFSTTVTLWCIKAKISQVHGFLNEIEVADSIFGPPVASQNFTRKDRVFFAVLYSGVLVPGMTAEEARRRLPALLSSEQERQR
jgi:hypothetical protein